MPISRHDETDLLTVLYEGALDDPPWSAFLARLRRRTAADYAALLVRPAGAPSDPATEQSIAAFASPMPRRRPLAALYRRAPSLYHALRVGRVHTREEFLGADDADHAAQLAPDTLGHLRLMRVREPDGANAWLVLGRAGQDFSATTGSLLSALGAHLSIALRLSAAIDRQRDRAFVASTALSRLGIGWLTIDARGRVIDHDDYSGRHFVRHMPLQDSASRSAADEIAAIMRRADGRPRAVRLSGEPRVDILILPLPRQAEAGAIAAVYVDAEDHPDASTREARSAALRALFGLSPTEARLADAISRGEAIARAAARIGITEQTARNYSKRIYAKTATSGQADLARLVLTGLAGLA
ncbi:helix-turn-helix transcriptional regulator [uncultured Sphingomonas sp.]|uniref:helix-turn-helix transcriptional regulator n=1 Tax=uncultured Sphingomonas sp. TaxID=158754 RepID=UPI0035C96F5A